MFIRIQDYVINTEQITWARADSNSNTTAIFFSDGKTVVVSATEGEALWKHVIRSQGED